MNTEPLPTLLDRRVLRVTATIFALVCSVAALFVFAATSLSMDVRAAHGPETRDAAYRRHDPDPESRE